MPVAPGDLIREKYRPVKLIGQGGMANVWLAVDVEFDSRLVAIKEPRSDLSATEQEFVQERFRRELMVCAALTKAGVPNLVSATMDISSGETRLLFMDDMPGGDLAGLIKKHPEGLPIEAAIQITLEIGEAVARIGTEVVRLRTFPLLEIPENNCRHEIIERSHRLYCRGVDDVKAGLSRRNRRWDEPFSGVGNPEALKDLVEFEHDAFR